MDSSSESGYKSFIDALTSGNGTGLYFADYTALGMMRDYSEPPNLKNVALVTFTDGLDNISLANDDYNPENYVSQAAYRNALHDMIVDEDGIHGKKIEAYTIGLKGNDVTDTAMFEETLKKLSSSDSNVFNVADMDEAKEHFREIAEGLYSISKTVNLDVLVPGGYDDGQLLRFTFDNKTATASNLYIEATYRRVSGRTLENITYHGLASLTTVATGTSAGAYHHFVFEELKYAGSDTPISDADINKIMLWKETSTGGWDKESEFDPASSVDLEENKNSALIMLVLDCTTSLGGDFSRMKQAAKDFVTTLVNGGAETQVSDCTGLPANAQWNTASEITQTWNGTSWTPTTTGAYSETASTEKCYFKCASGYSWNGSQCVIPSNPCSPNPCSSISNSTGVCTVSGSSYVCGCNSGYDWSGLACVSGSSPSLPECSSSSGTPCKDSSSGLIWSAKASSTYTWQNAVNYCSSYSEGGLSGWHLPTISELRTLIKNCSGTQMPGGSCGVTDSCLSSSCWTESACYSCSYDSTGGHSKFGETDAFWSSSTTSDDTDYAWFVYFSFGRVLNYYKSYDYYVRCVR